MDKKVGRNDPCPCGSGKKYKQCCFKQKGTKKKFTAKVISSGPKKEAPPGPDLVERTFGKAIRQIEEEKKKKDGESED